VNLMSKSSSGYELYHKDFSSAMQHAYAHAKKKGYTVDPNEIDSKVATGPRKPSKGKTNKYILGTDKKQNVHIQVYGMDSGKYELNMYIEEVEIDENKLPDMRDALRQVRTEKPVQLNEGKMKELQMYIQQGKSAEWIAKKMGVDVKTIKALMSEAYELGTNEYREYIEKLTPGEVDEADLDEANYEIKNGKIHISKKDYAKKPKEYKGKRGGKPTLMALDPKTGSTTSFEVVLEDVEVDEASARADAMRAMRKGKEVDPADVDTDASPEDIKGAERNIIMQLRKVVSLKGIGKVQLTPKQKRDLQKKDSKYLKTLGSGFVEFKKGQEKVDLKVAQAVLNKFNSIKKPADKEKFQAQVGKSYKDMLRVLKAGYNEEVDLDEGIKVGDNVHLGFGAKGGTGFKGKVIKIDSNNVHIKNPEGKEYKGPMKFVTKEEVDLDEAEIAFKTKAKDGGYFVVLHRDTSGMRGKQDKFLMRHMKGGKVKDWGSHVSVDGAKKFAKNKGIIEEKETILDRIDRKLKEKKELLEASNRWELAGKKFSLINDKGTFILVPQGRPGKEQKLKAKTSQDATQELVKKGYKES